jgi:hypothetical protein
MSDLKEIYFWIASDNPGCSPLLHERTASLENGFKYFVCTTVPDNGRRLLMHDTETPDMTDRKHLTAGEIEKLLAAAKGTRNETRDMCFYC